MAIVIVGMLDEREDILKILKDRIERRGQETVLIDISIGTGAIVPSLKPDVGSSEVVGAVGLALEEVTRMLAKERERATQLVAEGLTRKVMELHKAEIVKGIVAVGGMTGAFIALNAMKALPFGLPKLLMSSAAAVPQDAPRLADYFGFNDITVMHTVVDTVGMNSLIETLAANGAHAISGMVEAAETTTKKQKPSLAMTEFGFCEKGAYYVRGLVEGEYEVVSFHATGLGDRAAVDFVSRGLFTAFIDLVPSSFGDYLLGGSRVSGPYRLDACRDLSIPYILSPCGFDMMACGPIERRDKNDPLWVSRRLAERKYLVQDASRVQARTNAEEMQAVALAVAEKLGRYKHKKRVKFVIPKRGFSSLSAEGGALYDPDSDKAFVAALKKHIDPEIEICEVDSDMNSREFAQAVVDALSRAFAVGA